MRIKSMRASFGKLKNSALELSPGLNVITAPNESGKSTWCAFIKAMLYGIDTSERDSAGRLAVKNRYRPWDDGAMEGSMEVTWAGNDVTIERSGTKSSPMKTFTARMTGTGEVLSSMTGESAGEMLTGVPEHVFERTAYINRPGIKVSQDGELEKRIAALVTTGQEGASYSETDALLRSWQRRIRYNKTGLIPTMEQELEAARASMRALERSVDELAEMRSAISTLKKSIDSLEEDMRTHEKLEKQNLVRRIRELRSRANQFDRDVASMSAELTVDDHLLTRDDTNSMRSTIASVQPLRAVAEAEDADALREKKNLEEAIEARQASPLSSAGPDEADADAAEALRLTAGIEEAKKKALPRWPWIVLAVLTAAAVILGVAGIVSAKIWIAAAVILGAGAAAAYMRSRVDTAEAEAKLRAVLGKYGLSSAAELDGLRAAYGVLCRACDDAQAEYEESEERRVRAVSAADEAEREALDIIAKYAPGVNSVDEAYAAIDELDRRIEALTRAQFEALSSRSVYESQRKLLEDEGDADDVILSIPLRNKADTAEALTRRREQLSQAQSAYDVAVGQQRSLGDPILIEGRINTLTERIEEEKAKYNALQLAVETLSDANSRLQSRFSPLISAKASSIFHRLTGGKYEKLVFDRNFNASAMSAGEVVSRAVMALSEGTNDEVYLSLRLAMCSIVLGEEDACPIIIDDALDSFDDERCAAALNLLAEMGRHNQIILFTCHERESSLLPDDAAKKIRL